MTSSIRKCLNGFFKLVHPDMLSSAPLEAKEVNTRAIQELNAYIDRLEAPGKEPFPTVTKELKFFRQVVTASGKRLDRVRPCSVSLPAISPGTDFWGKENIAVKVIRDLELAVNHQASIFTRTKPEDVESIIEKQGPSARKVLDDMWERKTVDTQLKMALFEYDDQDYIKRQAVKKAVYDTQILRLTRKYQSIKNPRIRKLKLSTIEEKAKKAVTEKLGPDQQKSFYEETYATSNESHQHTDPSQSDQSDLSSPLSDNVAKFKIIEAGYHPDLVFFSPNLTPQQKDIGIKRICGIGSKEDMWLLKNIWEVVRTGKPPVPLVIDTQFSSKPELGFFTIPFDFTVNELADFLEENLDDLRMVRDQIIKEAKLAV